MFRVSVGQHLQEFGLDLLSILYAVQLTIKLREPPLDYQPVAPG
jgi:hypothetical protein